MHVQLAPDSSRVSRKTRAPRRPAGGWSLLVRSLGARQEPPYVAKPGAKRRPLTPSEKDQFYRQMPIPRRRQL